MDQNNSSAVPQKNKPRKTVPSGIILYNKKIGVTSFQSLGAIKRALGTKKIGHTGTLDSFASGLLVVCVGSLTRLASHITAFDKEYDAVIKFGAETDTLELTGNVVRNAPLPFEDDLRKAVATFTGEIDQVPPQFSAIHVDGKRASEMMRSGENVELPARRVTVYSAEIRAIEYTDEAASDSASAGINPSASGNVSASGDASASGDESPSDGASPSPRRVQSAKIHFAVSKGTYIRSLARDIANECGSAAHLTALTRTRVGSFDLKDAVGEEDDICAALLPMTATLAAECGFGTAHLRSEYVADFRNGRPLKKSYFADFRAASEQNAHSELRSHSEQRVHGELIPPSELRAHSEQIAVFSESEDFLGLIQRDEKSKLSYVFVISNA